MEWLEVQIRMMMRLKKISRRKAYAALAEAQGAHARAKADAEAEIAEVHARSEAARQRFFERKRQREAQGKKE